MGDSDERAPAEPSRAAAAQEEEEEEAPAGGGARGGRPERAGGPSDRPPGPAENAPKPKKDFLESLPHSVRCRVLALKKLQKRCDKIEAKFDKEFQALEKKYNDIYKPLLAKIQELTGEMEGCAWTLEGEEEEEEEDDEDEEEEGEDEDEEEEDAAAAAAKEQGPRSAGSDDAKK